MEVEVRVVAGIESCFVSLPLYLIQTLESTRSGSGPLPPFLALELHSRDSDQLWHVSWSGSASASDSSAIEIAQQFAECIYLSDHTIVQVRAVPNLPKATLVTIEPHTEDDWEVLELNAELAEASILKQVGLVHEGMRFPLWLRGRTIITFLVVSTFPKNHIGIYLKRCNLNLKKDIPSFSLSPCQFKMFRKEATENNDLEVLGSHKNRHSEHDKTYSDTDMGITDWSAHERVVAALSYESLGNENKEAATRPNSKKGILSLLHAWCLAQLDAIVSNSGVDVTSLIFWK